ncbi:TPA: hypothetical protein ACYEKW_004350 [Escherichia coli]
MEEDLGQNEKSPVPVSYLSLLDGIKTWKKTFITIVLVFAFGVGMTLYQQRRILIYAALDYFGAPQIDASVIDDEAQSLLAETGAISLSVWSVNIPRNQRTVLYARIGAQRLTNLEGLSDVALRPDSEHSAQLIRLLSDNTTCYDVVQVTPVGQAAAKAGVNYVCSARVPQKAGVFLGIIALGFKEKPANEDYVRIRLAQAADKLII